VLGVELLHYVSATLGTKMRFLFGKKTYPPIESIDLESHEWQISKSSNPTVEPIIIRKNLSAEELKAHPSYGHQCYLTFKLNSPNEDGSITTKEFDELGAIENQICPILEQKNESILVAVVTTKGVKDLIWYTSNPEAFKLKVEQIITSTPSHKISCEFAPDPKWKIYSDLP
jgi:hypothetical protein